MIFDKIEDAVQDIKAGKVVVVVDDEGHGNEGDFISAAQTITPEIINFMATYGRGLICCPLIEDRCEELSLKLMAGDNTTALHATPFTVSVDLIGHGCTTGISASDRAKTVLALANPKTNPESLGKPGHIFPLKAKKEGVLRRAGHAEAAIDLARLAGFEPAGALVKIMNEDGSTARLDDLVQVAKRFKLKLISIEDIIKYRMGAESLITREVAVELPTKFGAFDMYAFTEISNGSKHLALVKGKWEKDEPVLVRVHSSCVTGDIFGSSRCDCGSQLHKAMELVDQEGKGVIVYMDQEGRGIGLINKLKAYKLQEQGRDTVEANLELGFEMDPRDYGVGAQILHDLGVTKMRLISNNHRKRSGLMGYGLEVVENIPIEIAPNRHNQNYLMTKRDKLGHRILMK
jgi:3,4-dihydroxy 2-butanone 4-phosphate synthase/GTP cyclohydrolase II